MSKAQAGVHLVGLATSNQLNWLFREQPVGDYGIDAHLEVVYEGAPTGKLIAVQIKAGQSYFAEEKEDGWIYRGQVKHLEYWTGHSLPILVIICNLESKVCYWQNVIPENVCQTKKGWSMLIPKVQTLSNNCMSDLDKIANRRSTYEKKFDCFVIARSFMDAILSGDSLFLECEEWINKTSGRGSLKLVLEQSDGKQSVKYEWSFIAPGWDYPDLFRQLYPWAEFEIDHELYENFDEDIYSDECRVRGFEEDQLFFTMSFNDWLREQQFSQIRPYTVKYGEVALYRLKMTLNSLGSAFTVLDDYMRLFTGQE